MKQTYRVEFQNFNKYKYTKQEAINYIVDKGYGETILFEELGKIFNLSTTYEPDFIKLKQVVGRLKPILIPYGIVLKTIVNVGWYILKPKQISGYCYHAYIRKTEKMLEKSERILSHVDQTKLSNIRIQEHNEVKELNKDLSSKIEKTIDESKYIKNRYKYDNLDD